MKILFSPEYSGTVYAKAPDGAGVMMDTVVVNTIGLVNLLELRLGLHYDDVSGKERTARYYKALCEYMAAHPDNVMSPSFKTAGLATAQSMLAWRDELRGADWNFTGKDISDRLAVLVGVEEYFSTQGGVDIVERIHRVRDLLTTRKLACNDIVIEMAVSVEVLKPMTKKLIKTLEGLGATIAVVSEASDTGNNLSKVRNLIASNQKGTITLNKNDNSILIWKFTDERLACEYLAYTDMDDVDVWVDTDNKQMDNWLHLMNKTTTGSVTANCVPQLTQLFVMGLGMFANPLNVNTLIEWLNMPIHPIEKFFRARLAEAIVRNGGYRNAECKSMIEQFVEGAFVYIDREENLTEEETKKRRMKDYERRKHLVDVFLPSLESSDTIATEDVKRFVMELSSWTRRHALLMARGTSDKQWGEQLMAVSGMCDAFQILLETVKEPTIDFKTIDSWMSTVYQMDSYTNAIAERGCRIVVDSPAKFASMAEKTVWVGVDGDASKEHECAFLYPSERAGLVHNDHVSLWEENLENMYHEQMLMTPLRMTSGQLILVVRERIGGEPTLKHPLIVRLEQQIENFDDIVVTPFVGKEDMHKVEKIERGDVPVELEFDHADKIQWPNHLSPTSIGTLAEYPFDYLMERLLDITNDGKAQMADVKTIQGNVAHAVIEKLFAPRGDDPYATPAEIKNRMKNEFEDVYAKVVDANGAILLLVENKFKERLLHEQLHACLESLLEILTENELKVTGCEKYVEGYLGIGLPKVCDAEGKLKERDVLGFIDMTLKDKDGHPVVIDFKWTTWVRGYKNKLIENRSVQLEFYRMMLGREKKDEVKRVAYFLMPAARLYSREVFKGKNCYQLPTENSDNIVEQLKQSAKYRIEQIRNGVVEVGGTFNDLQYVKDTETRGLYPLKQDSEGKRESNFFSSYGLFIS